MASTVARCLHSPLGRCNQGKVPSFEVHFALPLLSNRTSRRGAFSVFVSSCTGTRRPPTDGRPRTTFMCSTAPRVATLSEYSTAFFWRWCRSCTRPRFCPKLVYSNTCRARTLVLRDLTFDMSGRLGPAQPAQDCPLDGRVGPRHYADGVLSHGSIVRKCSATASGFLDDGETPPSGACCWNSHCYGRALVPLGRTAPSARWPPQDGQPASGIDLAEAPRRS